MSRSATKTIKCKWCGKFFIPSYPTVKYCCDECRIESRGEQSRNKSYRWYHKNKYRLTEKQRYGLGNSIRNHRNSDFNKEKKIIENELKRLKLK